MTDLLASEVPYFCAGDEKAFFDWLRGIRCVTEVGSDWRRCSSCRRTLQCEALLAPPMPQPDSSDWRGVGLCAAWPLTLRFHAAGLRDVPELLGRIQQTQLVLDDALISKTHGGVTPNGWMIAW